MRARNRYRSSGAFGLVGVAAGLALWLVAAAACAPGPPGPSWSDVDRLIAERYSGVPQMTTELLAETLDAGRRPVVLLDAREAEEYAVSHLAGAHHAQTVEEAMRILRNSPPDALVVAYCSVGVRSSALAARLRERGITEVHNLQGSLFAWANEGRPVYRGRTRVAEVHPFDAWWGTLLQAARPGESAP
ncbi:MAG: rhodanese-like domain-containing protein [Acidobacteria bacterium]|nr:rhodanese-like domain-containing protein [Acidobacteriota bacterium]